MKLANLKISSQSNPVGIDGKPYFSYELTSEKRNVTQENRSIKVSNGDKVVWEKSEKSGKSAFIPYEGELKSRTRYAVEIVVTDNYGESDSITGYFETGLLNENDWQAKWVKSSLPIFEAEKGFGKQPPATMFQRNFTCKKQVKRARVYCTCHGIYRLYLNGKRFEEGEFAPEHSTYRSILFYQTYDLTKFLQPGENTFSMYVGDGWYLGTKTTPNLPNYERRHAVLFQIEIEYQGGEREIVLSDANVECAYGGVVASDLFAGEIFDANKKFENWQKGVIADYSYRNLTAQIGEPVICSEELPVRQIIHTPKGETLLDFGKVLAGRVRFSVREKKGSVVTLTHSEVLDKEGNFFQNTEMPDGGVEQKIRYIADGTESVYEPLFTYHGFRYVKVERVTDVKKEDFTARVYTTKKENTGSFVCSDERLNRLYRNIRNSQTSNMLSIPTDCPQREKAGWTGDIGIYARTALLNEDITAFLNRWLLSVGAEQAASGAIPLVVPYDGNYPYTELMFGAMFDETEIFGSSGWGDCCISVPYAMYCVTGDTEVIRKNLAVMEKWCAYILNRCALPCKTKKIPEEFNRYLWNRGYHQGDWLVPSLSKKAIENPTDDYFYQMNLTAQYAAPMYGYRSFDLLAKMTEAIGENEKSRYYRGVADKMKEAIGKCLFDGEGNLPTGLMGAYVLAIAFDLVPEKFKTKTAEKLVLLLKENDGCLDTGFLSTPFLPDALCAIGRRDLAYSVLYQTKCPGWLYEVERGATAVWESWESYEEDGTPKKISFNHYAFGCVDDWISRNICGLVPQSAGFRTMKIQPLPDSSLRFAERKFHSVYGEIAVKWEKREGKFILDCSIPCNTAAEIILPSGKSHSVGSGSYRFEEELA